MSHNLGEDHFISDFTSCFTSTLSWVADLIQPLFVVPIPHVHEAVRAPGCKGPVAQMKCHRVDWVDEFPPLLGFPVALEGVLFGLARLGGVEVLHRYSALNRTQGITCKNVNR